MLRLALRAGASGPATRARFSSRAGADVAAPSGRQPLPDVSPASAESSIRAALNGSLKLARRHLFIVSEDEPTWASHPNDTHPLASAIGVQLFRQRVTGTNVSLCCPSPCQGPGAGHALFHPNDILLFPEGWLLRPRPRPPTAAHGHDEIPAKAGPFAEAARELGMWLRSPPAPGLEPPDGVHFDIFALYDEAPGSQGDLAAGRAPLPRPPGAATALPLGDVFVCTHKARDARCGFRGRPVRDALSTRAAEALAVSGRPAVRVWSSTHLGQHHLAGILTVFPRGDFYGLLSPEHAVQLFDTIVPSSHRLGPHAAAAAASDSKATGGRPRLGIYPPRWRGTLGIDSGAYAPLIVRWRCHRTGEPRSQTIQARLNAPVLDTLREWLAKRRGGTLATGLCDGDPACGLCAVPIELPNAPEQSPEGESLEAAAACECEAAIQAAAANTTAADHLAAMSEIEADILDSSCALLEKRRTPLSTNRLSCQLMMSPSIAHAVVRLDKSLFFSNA